MPRAAAAELRGDAAATMLRYATLRDARRATALRRCALPLYAYAGAARDYAMRRRVAAMLMFYARSRARSKSACATSRYSNMAAKTAIVIIDAASGSHGAVCPFFALQRCRAAMPRVFDDAVITFCHFPSSSAISHFAAIFFAARFRLRWLAEVFSFFFAVFFDCFRLHFRFAAISLPFSRFHDIFDAAFIIFTISLSLIFRVFSSIRH
jgi:hypothetical protein